MRSLCSLVAIMLVGFAFTSVAQTPHAPLFEVLPYGSPISMSDAQVVAAAAVQEAKRRGLYPTVAIVDQSGSLLYFEKDDRAIYAAEDLAILSARGAARFGHGGDSWQQQMDNGELSILFLPGPVYQAGGSQVIVRTGKIIGAIGVSAGAGSKSDAEIGKIAVRVLKP